MRYLHGYGVIVPFAKKYKHVLFMAVAAIFVVSQATVLAGFAGAAPKEKIVWCHTEPNGNQQTLELPQEALENAGHVNANGQPLHAGDHAGACVVEEELEEVVPAAVTFTDPTCKVSGFYTVPSTENVTYKVDGSEVAAGDHDVSDGSGVTVVAVAGEGFFIDDETTATWTHTFSTPDCEEEEVPVLLDTVDDVVPHGTIQGLIYHDQNNNGTQDPTEPPLEGWTGWLLTHNSPFTLAADYVTGDDGIFVWHDLPFGTYYVCQDLKDTWLQTELAALGDGLAPVPVGTVIGDSPELDALVAEFCYQVTIDAENPISSDSVFGNYQPPEEEETPPDGQVLGDTTDNQRPDPEKPDEGQVLAASTGSLENTGQESLWPMLLGVFIIVTSIAALRLSRPKQQL